MRIWEVLKALEKDSSKLFMVRDYNYWVQIMNRKYHTL